MDSTLDELYVIADVEPVLSKFRARRSAVIKALTDDFEQFYAQCDPNVEGPLCLYGDSNGQWRVAPPPRFADPEHPPQPVRDINVFRDRMSKEAWLKYVAHHSDLWKLLYKKIDQLPQVLEVVINRRNNARAAQVQQIFSDFMARRRALTTALTEDFNEFYWKCDPEGGNLCLLGDTNGLWRVGPPDENVTPGLPQPERCNLGIEDMSKLSWRSLVACNSQFWLLSLASFEAANNNELHQADRERLYDMIYQLPTLSDIVKEYHNL